MSNIQAEGEVIKRRERESLKMLKLDYKGGAG